MRSETAGVGVGLVEVYDLSSASNSMLANISNRGFVGTCDQVMITGFIIGSQKVIVRALGPSLASHGISHLLADPTMELHDSNGALVAADDNWKDDSQAIELQAMALAPADYREAATVDWLPPGATPRSFAESMGRPVSALLKCIACTSAPCVALHATADPSAPNLLKWASSHVSYS